MTLSAEPPQTRALDPETRAAFVAAVDVAKARGWLQPDLRRYFKSRGIEFSTYSAAKAGQVIDSEAAGVFAQISITGLPGMPHAPNAEDIRRHIEWLTAPARGAYDDALFEIAYDGEGRGPSMARLFGLDEIEAAIVFAVSRNVEWRNVYIGAALRDPETDRTKRSTGDDFYVATAVPIDIDHDYDATRARMAAVCDDGLVITTGLTPERRSQHWAQLQQPCDDDLAFEHAFGALVSHTGADMKVKDKARIMRLGGTVSFPRDAKKLAAGYCTELTAVAINERARPADVEALKALEPGAATSQHFDASNRPQGSGVERRGIVGTGTVYNGREEHFRNLLLKHLHRFQDENGCDPDADDLWAAAFGEFSDPALVDNSDGRWTSGEGQRELRTRLANTLRRLRAGRLARVGLYSVDTGVGQDEAEAVRAARAATAPREVTDFSPTSTGITVADPSEPPLWNLRAWNASVYSGHAPDIQWLCDGTIPLGIPVLFASMGGLGKSFIAIDLGLAIAIEVVAGLSSRPILGGEVVQTGTAVILSAEDSKDSIHRRLEKIDPDGRRHQSPERLIIVPLPDAGGPKPLIASDGKSLSMTPAFYALRAELMAIPDLKVIVIDPLQAFVMADVNSDPAAGQFMWSAFASLCAATGATLIIPHHMRKDGAASIKNADQAREAIRGSTALVDGARLAYALWKADAEDGRDMCSRLDVDFAPERIAFGAVVKANDQANRDVQTYVRRDSGLLVDASDRVASANVKPGASMQVLQGVVAEIDAAWHSAVQGRGEGYAVSPQSGDRQVWKLIQRRTGCSPKEARDLASAWVANGILQMQTVNPKLHRSALRAIGTLG